MSGKKLIEYYKKIIKNDPELDMNIWINCDFGFDDDIDVKRAILVCGEESNYEIFPFGRTSEGSTYALLNSGSVAYISSEGECGIIARNVNEFFNIMLACKDINHYFIKDVFINFNRFKELFNKINSEAENPEIIAKFMKSQNFETSPEKIYELFLRGLISAPSLVLQANPEKYYPWDDLFGTDQEYIEELRNKAKKILNLEK